MYKDDGWWKEFLFQKNFRIFFFLEMITDYSIQYTHTVQNCVTNCRVIKESRNFLKAKCSAHKHVLYYFCERKNVEKKHTHVYWKKNLVKYGN